jgi:hypothetical protein
MTSYHKWANAPIVIYTNAAEGDKRKLMRLMRLPKYCFDFRPLPALWIWM